MYKAKYEQKYTQEINEIRQSYREFAIQLFKQNKPALMRELSNEKDNYLRQLAVECDKKVQQEKNKIEQVKE